MRVRLSLPEKKIFETTLKLGVESINYGAHLAHDRVLTLCHNARLEWLAFLGKSEIDCFGESLIMISSACEYKGQAYLGDLITLEIFLGELRSSSFDLYYRLKKGNTCIALAMSGLVFFNYEEQKTKRAPQDFLEAVN